MTIDLETRAANMAREQIADGSWVSGDCVADQLGVQRSDPRHYWVAMAATRVMLTSSTEWSRLSGEWDLDVSSL